MELSEYLCDMNCMEITEPISNILIPTEASRSIDRLIDILNSAYNDKIQNCIMDTDDYETYMSVRNLPEFLGEALFHISVYDFVHEPCAEEEFEMMFEFLESRLRMYRDMFFDWQLSAAVKRLKNLNDVVKKS